MRAHPWMRYQEPGRRSGAFTLCIMFLLFFYPVFSCQAVSTKYKSIVERDPFDPKRGQDKSAIEGGAVSTQGSELEQKYHAYGVIIAGQNKSAFIKPVKSKGRNKAELRKVTVGDLVDGWTVKDINDRGVILVSGDQEVALKVFTRKEERKSDKPVGVATPRLAPILTAPAIGPSGNRPVKSRVNGQPGHIKPQVKPDFIFPKNQANVNPFLKALQRQKKREGEIRRKREEDRR